MSLREAVNHICSSMEGKANEWARAEAKLSPKDAAAVLLSYARDLLISIVAAAEPPAPSSWVGDAVEKERRKKEDGLEIKVKEQVQKEEASGETMTEIADGPLGGDNIMRPASMPLGARTNIAGSVYELKEDHRFHCVNRAGI